jgi:hypothetical protein
MGPRSRSTAQEGDAFCLLEIHVRKCKSITEQQRTLWKCWRKQVQKYLYPQWKWVYRHNMKGHSIRKKPLFQNRHKNWKKTTVCNCIWGQISYFLEKCPLVWWNKNRTVWP